jgi:hypothetical protein
MKNEHGKTAHRSDPWTPEKPEAQAESVKTKEDK